MWGPKALLRWLRQIPVPAQDARRADVFVLCSLSLSGFCAAFSVRYITAGHPELAALVGSLSAGLAINLLVLHRTGAIGACTNIALSQMYACLVAGSTLTGGFDSFTIVWAYVMGLMAFILCGPRRGWLWNWLCVLSVIGLWALRRAGVELPHPIPVESRLTEALLNITGSMLAAATLSSFLLRSEQAALRALETQIVERREAEERADRANKAKTDFLACMSHEIRTPIGGVLGIADLLSDTPLERRQRRLLDTIRSCGRDLIDLLDMSLDHAKIEAGEIELRAEPLDLYGLMQQLTDLLVPPAAEKGLGFSLAYASHVPHWVIGDRIRIRQIVLNLMSNALKFTDSGSIEIRVELPEPEDGARGVCIEVEDSGIGIPEPDRERVFERFARVDQHDAQRPVGTGLGLAICRDLAERMGGSLGLKSTPDQGSCFRLYLPAPTCAAPATRAEGARRWTGRILVVDDDLVNLEIARSLLEHLGCEVCAVTSGPVALEKLDQGSFDLALLDCEMPEMDGLELLAAIRDRQGHGAYIPAVVLTAHSLREDRERCLGAGADGVLTKPVDVKLLQDTVTRFLRLADEACLANEALSDPIEGERPSDPEPATRRPRESGSQRTREETLMSEVLTEARLNLIRELDPDGSEGLLSRMVAAFSDQAPRHVAGILEAATDGDLDTLASLAHSVKSAAANLGAERLQQRAQRLERAALEKRRTDLGPDLDGLENDLHLALRTLQSLIT